jgi:hypothetical protein
VVFRKGRVPGLGGGLFLWGGDWFKLARRVGCEFVASGAIWTGLRGGTGELKAGLEGRLELVSAEVEGHARDAVEDAGWCGLATTYSVGRQHRGKSREYLSPVCRNAWQEVQEQ